MTRGQHDSLQAGLVKSPGLIKRLLSLLAHQAVSEVSVSELAAQLQMARPTVERYLDAHGQIERQQWRRL
jgi:uncharacterized protein